MIDGRYMFSKKAHCDKVLALWSPIKEKIYWVIVSIVNDKHLAEDILQESLIIAIDKFQTLRDESKFEPWLITISIRKAYEVLGKRNVFVNMQSLDDGFLFEENNVDDNAFSTLQYKDMVGLILEYLKPESKKYLFYLRYVEDRSMEDIIRITDLKEGTLKSIYSRMRKDLSQLLGKEYCVNE